MVGPGYPSVGLTGGVDLPFKHDGGLENAHEPRVDRNPFQPRDDRHFNCTGLGSHSNGDHAARPQQT